MLHLVKPTRSYPPETVAIMTAAFDSACQSLSTQINGSNPLCEKLALIILRYVDDGERDPERLAQLSFRELAVIDGTVT